MQNVYFSERSKLDIKLDYLKSSTSSQSPSSSATKLRNPKLFQDRYGYKRTLEPSSSSYIWDSPRSKLRISCNDSNHCQCLMCRENGSLAVHYWKQVFATFCRSSFDDEWLFKWTKRQN